MLPHALRLLLRLRAGAFFRKLKRDFRNPRKAGYAIFIYAGVVLYLAMFALMHWADGDAQRFVSVFRGALPVLMLAYYGLVILSSVFRFPLVYSPAEIQLLFPAPIGRRAVLNYKLVIQSAGMVVGASIAALFLAGAQWQWFPAWLGLSLFGLFGIYTGAAVAMIVRVPVGRLLFAGTCLVLVGVAVALIAPVVHGLSGGVDQIVTLDFANRLDNSALYRAVMFPFNCFADLALGALRGMAWWTNFAFCATLSAVSFGAVHVTDRGFQEGSIEASRKRQDQLERLKSGKWGRGKWSHASRIRVPALPRMGGAGPTLHRQLLSLLRARTAILALGVVFGLAVAAGLWAAYRMELDRDALIAASAGALLIGAYSTLFASMWLRLDFHADYGNLDYLKTLPIRPICLAAGELATPALAAFICQIVPPLGFSLGAGVLFAYWPFALLLLPANVVWFAVDNAFYLRAPSPVMAGPTPDPSLMGRRMVTSAVQVLFVGAVVALTAGAAWVTWMATGSAVAAWIAAWLVIVPCTAAVVHLTAVAFRDLDISRDKA